MRVVTDLLELERGRPTIVTMGGFDGVHRGHQFLIRGVVDRARRLDYDAAIITFDPRPAVVLRPGSRQLASSEEKARIIRAVGPNILVILRFDQKLSEIPPGEFLVNLLDHINLAEFWVGADFAFGHKRKGDVDFLIRSGQQSGFGVHVVARQKLGPLPISSSAIRELISTGDVGRAAVLLGHYFRIHGEIVTGAGRGTGLGVPTANLRVPDEQQLPGDGVYAGRLHAEDMALSAAISVGYNPQFDGQELSVEAHVLDFQGDLGGQEVALDFVERLRDQQRFPSIEGLKEAMAGDIQRTREILQGAQEPGELILGDEVRSQTTEGAQAEGL